MIISCYPGVGKTTISKGRIDIIDLDSSLFSQLSTDFIVYRNSEGGLDNVTNEFWPYFYVKIAEKLSQDGYIVLVSSHKEVRARLLDVGEDFYCITPVPELKDEWIEKLRVRWETSGSEKDLRAYEHVRDNYDKDVHEIISMKYDCPVCHLDGMDYDLEQIIEEATEIKEFGFLDE